MKTKTNNKEKNNKVLNSGNQKPFLSIDSELSVLDLYKILKKNPYLINIEDEKNETFLSYAIKRNNNPIINLLLTSPLLNLTYQNENGNTYLHLAVIQQNIKLVQALLDKGIFIDIQNNDGNTALHLSYYINNIKIIKLLINNNIDFGIKNKKGLTAEEIDPIENINEIAGYEVNMNIDNCNNDDYNNLCLNQNEDFNLKNPKVDSSNSGETRYKSQFSKDKKRFFNMKNEYEKSKLNEDKNKNKNKNNIKNITFKKEDNNSNNNMILDDLLDNNIKNKKKRINSNRNSFNDINNNEKTEDDNQNIEDLKTIDNNFPLYEEAIDSQEFDVSPLDISKKNNISNFLDNNELDLSNNNNLDNNSIHEKDFFNNEKGDNNSYISNIPIKNDEINQKNKNKNKKEKKKEKTINCSNKSLYEFLMQIHMEKYYDNLNNNGFEYINMIIDDTKVGNYITDKQLKLIGINIPGDRAKILIRFEEKASMFEFNIPKSVYYINYNLEHIENDLNICKLNGWLRNIRLEQYLKNFILNGYFSLDLLLIQSVSKNPLNDDILKDEFGIDKLGHRARILNKLKEESKCFLHKLRDSIVSFQTEENNKICSECIIS